jgi:hypothetical protein
MFSSFCLDQNDFPAFLFEFIHGTKISHVYVGDNVFAFGEVYLSVCLKLIPSIRRDRQCSRQNRNRREVRFKEGVEKNLRVGVWNVQIIQCMCNDDWAFDTLWQVGSIDRHWHYKGMTNGNSLQSVKSVN